MLTNTNLYENIAGGKTSLGITWVSYWAKVKWSLTVDWIIVIEKWQQRRLLSGPFRPIKLWRLSWSPQTWSSEGTRFGSKFLCAVPWTSRLQMSPSPKDQPPVSRCLQSPKKPPVSWVIFQKLPKLQMQGESCIPPPEWCDARWTLWDLWDVWEVWDTVRAVTLWDTARRLRHCRTLWDLWDGRGRKESLAA